MNNLFKRPALIVAVAGALASGSAFAQQAGSEVGSRTRDAVSRSADITLAKVLEGNDARVSKLIGKRVESAAGEDLGEVEDFLAASDESGPPTVVISIGGVLDVGDKWYATSFDELGVSGGKLVLDKTESELAKQPPFDYAPRAGTKSGQPGVKGPGALSSIGGLRGATVVDERGKSIGEIDDFVVSNREHGTRAVIELNSGAGEANHHLVAIPFDELVIEESGEEARGIPQQPRVKVDFEDTPIEGLPVYQYPSREVI